MGNYITEARVDKERLWGYPYNELRFWTRVWDDAMKRLQSFRRYEQSPILKLAFKRYKDLLLTDLSSALEIRQRAEENIARLVEELPEWRDWAKFVPAVGAQLFGRLIGYIGNPAARIYPSCLARHCGVAPNPKTGRIEKPQAGQVRPYNPKAKATLYLIITQSLKLYSRSPNLYAEIYATYKERYAQLHPDWTKMHTHLAAIIKAANFFVTHLWEVSRKAQGLPTVEIYPIEHLGHKTKIPPEMAVHPRKCNSTVLTAIRDVEQLLKEEEDQKVLETVSQIVEKMKQHTI